MMIMPKGDTDKECIVPNGTKQIMKKEVYIAIMTQIYGVPKQKAEELAEKYEWRGEE